MEAVEDEVLVVLYRTRGCLSRKLPPHQEGDWLLHHKEKGQTFSEFAAKRKKRHDHGEMKVQPLGTVDERLLQLTREFMAIFFCSCDVQILPLLDTVLPSRDHPVFGEVEGI